MVSQSCSLYVPCGLPRLPTSLRAKHDDDDDDGDDDGDGDGDGDERQDALLTCSLQFHLSCLMSIEIHFKLT